MNSNGFRDSERILVLGATGLLGRVLMAELRDRGSHPIGLARKNADLEIDMVDVKRLSAALGDLKPQLVLNAAGLVGIDACERDPGLAYRTNAGSVGVLVELCRRLDCRFVQVSTDHFFSGDGAAAHDESAPVTLVNEYARVKFAAESFVRTYPKSLVIRTNFTGWRQQVRPPTFIEWAVSAIRNGEDLTAFDDFYTSTIDAPTCAKAIIDLVEREHAGIINLGARDVTSKKEFLVALVDALGGDMAKIQTRSVGDLEVRRAESLGLDCSRAQGLLDWELPDHATVIRRLIAQAPS